MNLIIQINLIPEFSTNLVINNGAVVSSDCYIPENMENEFENVTIILSWA